MRKCWFAGSGMVFSKNLGNAAATEFEPALVERQRLGSRPGPLRLRSNAVRLETIDYLPAVLISVITASAFAPCVIISAAVVSRRPVGPGVYPMAVGSARVCLMTRWIVCWVTPNMPARVRCGGPVRQGEDRLAAGAGSCISGVAAALVKRCLALGVPGHAQLLDRLFPRRVLKPEQGRMIQPWRSGRGGSWSVSDVEASGAAGHRV